MADVLLGNAASRSSLEHGWNRRVSTQGSRLRVIYSVSMNKLAYFLVLPLVAAKNQLPIRNASQGSAVPMPTIEGGRRLSIRPVRWSVVPRTSPLQVTPGRTVPLTIQAEIAKGWHIYSLTQKSGGPIPL